MHIRMVVVLVLSGVIVMFMFQNAQVAELRLLFWTLAMSQALLLFLVFVIGMLTGWILRAWLIHQLHVNGADSRRTRRQ